MNQGIFPRRVAMRFTAAACAVLLSAAALAKEQPRFSGFLGDYS